MKFLALILLAFLAGCAASTPSTGLIPPSSVDSTKTSTNTNNPKIASTTQSGTTYNPIAINQQKPIQTQSYQSRTIYNPTIINQQRPIQASQPQAQRYYNQTNISSIAPFKGSCGSKRYCTQMQSCSEAIFYLKECHLTRLDKDGDGIPCESICSH